MTLPCFRAHRIRICIALMASLALGACAGYHDLQDPPQDLGNFHLGYNVVVAPNLTRGPASRKASKQEWIDAMTKAVGERFGRYDGDKLYHIAISVEGYVLAYPGIPILASPKSALILNVTVWDDAAQKKLNDKPHLVTAMENISTGTMIGSGLMHSKQQQMQNLSRSAAKLIEGWMVGQNEKKGWFGGPSAPGTHTGEGTDGSDDSADDAAPETTPDAAQASQPSPTGGTPTTGDTATPGDPSTPSSAAAAQATNATRIIMEPQVVAPASQ